MRDNVLIGKSGVMVVISLISANVFHVFRKEEELKISFINNHFKVIPIYEKYKPRTLIPIKLPSLTQEEINLLYELRKIFNYGAEFKAAQNQ